MNDLSVMVGKTMHSVAVNKDKDVMAFISMDGQGFVFYHSQDCCESVDINDICGDLEDLVGSPILEAEKSSNEGNEGESSTWTFYKFGTIKGSVTVRWLGESNGYYSEDVDFKVTTAEEAKKLLKS